MEKKVSPKTPELDLEEFSIMELDERLEFVAWNDGNCNCPGPKQQTP